MFWWFERRGELLRVEVLQLEEHRFELHVVQPDGTESVEAFADATALARRQAQVLSRMSQDGWTGPHGWLV